MQGEGGKRKRTGLQAKLSKLADERCLDALLASLAEAQDWAGQRRLNDICHPDCDHDWLRALQPAHRSFVPPAEFADCLRVRLGMDLSQRRCIAQRAKTACCSRDARTVCFAPLVSAPEATMLSGTR